MKKILLLLSVIVGFISCKGQNNEVIKTIEPAIFAESIKNNKNIYLLDVRTPGEFGADHIANATNIDFNDANFEKNISALDKSKTVYVYCLAGGRSMKAAQKLAEMGFKNIYNLDGGMLNWKKSGLSEKKENAGGLSKEEFEHILANNPKVFVDVYAKWCGPCKQMAPSIEALEKKYAGKIKVIKIDADKNEALVTQMGVSVLPTLFLFHDKKQISRHEGLLSPEELEVLFSK